MFAPRRAPSAGVLVFVPNEHQNCYRVHVERTGERAVADLAEALAGLRYPVASVPTSSDRGGDLVATLADGTQLFFQVKAYRTVTPDAVVAIARTRLPPGVVGIVVADQVTPAAGDELARAGWGWLDRRGHLSVQAGPLVIDTQITPRLDAGGRPSKPVLENRVALDVAVALLAHPDRKLSIRDLVAYTGRSLGAVHAAVKGLRAEGLIDERQGPLFRELFWEAADRWRPARIPIAERPRPGDARRTEQLHLGLDDITGGVGWAVTDALAANVFGAPAPVRGDDPPDFYVPDSRIVRVARALYREPLSVELRGATVAVAPVSWVCQHRVDATKMGRQHPLLDFGFVHPVIAALDLAADASRGREILESWTPPPPYVRVW